MFDGGPLLQEIVFLLVNLTLPSLVAARSLLAFEEQDEKKIDARLSQLGGFQLQFPWEEGAGDAGKKSRSAPTDEFFRRQLLLEDMSHEQLFFSKTVARVDALERVREAAVRWKHSSLEEGARAALTAAVADARAIGALDDVGADPVFFFDVSPDAYWKLVLPPAVLPPAAAEAASADKLSLQRAALQYAVTE